MYLVILNLPGEERYKRQNMLLVGIIPGPNEPSLNINSYSIQLVLEMHEFYKELPVQYFSWDIKCFDVRCKCKIGLFFVIYQHHKR